MLATLRAHTLRRYVLREFWKIFALALPACTLFMLILIVFMKAREWEDYGATAGRVALLAPYLLPAPLAFALPLAVMISVIMVFGRLMAENEMLAVQASGAPVRVLALPLLASALLLCGFSLWCQQGWLNWGCFTIRTQILKLDNPGAFLKNLEKEGSSVQHKLEDGSFVRINMLPHKVDPKTGRINHRIHIAYFNGHDVGRTILAEDYEYDPDLVNQSGRVLVLKLKDMQVLGSDPTFTREIETEMRLPALDDIGDSKSQKGWLDNFATAREIRGSVEPRRHFLLQRAADFGAQVLAGSAGDPAAPFLNATAWADGRLQAETIYATGGVLDRARMEAVEGQRKLALAFLPFSLCVLGVGLGLLVRKSQRMLGFLLGVVVYAVGYYPMIVVCKELSTAKAAGLWLLWTPNIAMLLLGYFIWWGYERGWMGGLPDFLSALGPAVANNAIGVGSAIWRPFSALRDWAIGRLRSKADGYISGSFLVPLVIVLLAVVVLFTGMDLAQRGGNVFEGIARAGEKVKDRTMLTAILDVATYYSISSLEWICDMLPLFVLLAGVLCVYMLVRNSEHLILKSSGVRLQRAFRPIIVTALVFSVLVAVLRETLLPSLIMVRSQLKPLVYSRNPNPTALALYTTDADGHPVLFQMSSYSSQQRSGKDLRVYLLAEEKDGRIPAIMADKATWCGDGWKLETDLRKNEKPGNKPALPLLEYGYKLQAERVPGTGANEAQPVWRTEKKKLALWRGGVTPPIIESEHLGPGVMTLSELRAASGVKREFRVEMWHRLPLVFMSIFLLWAAIPLLLQEEVRRPLVGVALCILLGGLYWALDTATVEAARDNYLPAWSPLLPHVAFLLFGLYQYNFAMET